MLIAQLSDLHVGFHGATGDEPNLRRVREALDALLHAPDTPDLLLLTGDLTERGDDASFALLSEALTDLPFPIWPIPGNHDSRSALARAFGQVPQDGSFLQYAIELEGLKILMLDSTEEGRHGGAFCSERASWLADQLDEQVPTLVVIHHPPVPVGIDWMDPGADEAWIARLHDTLIGQEHVCAILCGHVHRPIVSRFANIPLVSCPSSAPPLALDLRPVDPANADGRAMIIDAPPAYALHRWDGQRLTTHFSSVQRHDVLASYNAGFQRVVASLLAERG